MNVIYHETTRQLGEDYLLLEKASKRLEEIAGRSAGQVSAEWGRANDDQGTAVYTLKISDPYGVAHATFTPDLLRSPNRVTIELASLWGGILQKKSEKLIEDFLAEGQ